MRIEAVRLGPALRRRAPLWLKTIARRLPAPLVATLRGSTNPRPTTSPREGKDATRPVAAPPSLLTLARDAGWPLDPAAQKFLGRLEARLPKRGRRTIVILGDADAGGLQSAIARRWPETVVHLVRVSDAPAASTGLPAHRVMTPTSKRHAQLAAYGPVDVLIDVSRTSEANRLTQLRDVFFHLTKGGRFLTPTGWSPVIAGRESIAGFLARMTDLKHAPSTSENHPDDLRFAASIGSVTIENGLLMVTCSQPAMAKLRDWEVDDVLELRSGIGEIIDVRPALDFRPRGAFRMNRPTAAKNIAPVFHVPQVSLRSYRDVVWAPHQVLVRDQMLLPDTFRHNTHPRLINRFLDDVAPRFARYPKDLGSPRPLDGRYYFLDSEWPRHFGHLMTEQMSRLWGWRQAKALFPDLKALVPLPSPHQELTDFEIAVFTGAGIAREDLVTSRGVQRIEQLVAATPMLVNPDYVHPDIASIWRQVGDALFAAAPIRQYPEKLFASRRTTYKRACHNAEEVEEVFRAAGFEVVYPEDCGSAEQAAMFEHARVVAGFAGSALFNLCYCTMPKQVIMISSESYTARNEYMIGSVLGHLIDLIWCTPDLAQPDAGWDGKAFASGFTFDFQRDGEHLKQLLDAA